MNVATLQASRWLPSPFNDSLKAGKTFQVEIDGKRTVCRSLTDAQRATAGYPPETLVEMINAPA